MPGPLSPTLSRVGTMDNHVIVIDTVRELLVRRFHRDTLLYDLDCIIYNIVSIYRSHSKNITLCL